MARNSEKAMTTLARWRAAHLEGGLKDQERRPYLATECDELHKCEKWRRQIIGEVSRKVAQIQNAGLGEFKLRDLNDEINKLLREKGHWEDRIKELGGADYKNVGPKILDTDGKEVPGNKGYKYFGAAKDLPGVRDLFEQEPPKQARKTRAEMMKNIDADYYGYRDEDDGIIIPQEIELEKKVTVEKVSEWKERQAAIAKGEVTPEEDVDMEEESLYKPDTEIVDEEEMKTEEKADKEEHFIAHVPVPSQKQIEEALVMRKKMELLQKYASDNLQDEEQESKQLLGV
ncbi:pre-mRNA-splicing factor ISY1 homolog [Mytilus californianus]|uniref:pre-mRNA-splicing factor ISY1 homolog n=1 Tax=Mytilus californianus TaxID=6549 RepID=UPI002245652A|nr:pre-mRNA-splicing factor ISY1 homolog [Mytilus californianus]